MNTIPMKVTENLTVNVMPDSNHEFLMASKEVAKGYDVCTDTLRSHKRNMKEDLIEGKHFISTVQIQHGASPGSSRATMWTKRGIIRLGFSIKSDRAKLFRDWAEDLIITNIEKKNPTSFALQSKKLEERYVRRPEFNETIEIVESAILACGSANQLAARIGISGATLSLLKSRPWLVSTENLHGIELACRNILSRDARLDVDTFEQILMIKDGDLRLNIFNKMKKGGLI